jgi:hypothetical protein
MTSQDRAVQLLRARRRNTLLSVVVGYTTSWMVGSHYLSDIVFWFAFVLGGAGLTWLLFFVTNMWSLYSIFKGNFHEVGIGEPPTSEEAIDEDEDDTDVINVDLEIAGHPEKPVGKFMDAEFYEWIDFKFDGKVRRANFFGTANLRGDVVLPDRGVLIQPGLIYQFDQVDAS